MNVQKTKTKTSTKKTVVTKAKVMNQLKKVVDPELHISIVDLGLVYNVVIDKKNNVEVTMTLTTMGCPLFPVIEQDVINKLYLIGCEHTKVQLTFDPPWSMERLTENAKAMLGM